MKKINIKAAEPMPVGCKQPEPVIIEISGKISELTYDSPAAEHKSLDDVKKIFEQESEKLIKALLLSLPQGMIEPITIKLLEHRVSLYHGIDQPKIKKQPVENPCIECGDEWDQTQFDECPHCGNVIPF